MGNDAALPVLSNRPKVLYSYFKQLFAQVTNPPIDPIREELVMSLVTFIGPRPNLLGIDVTDPAMRLEAQQPILTNDAMEKIRHIALFTDGAFKSFELDICYPAAWGANGMEAALASLCAQAEDAIHLGYNILIVSDRKVSAELMPIPALLATAAVHQHLVRKGLRTSTGLVVETGSAREVHHFALLAGYGAEAIHPYLALETLVSLAGRTRRTPSPQDSAKRFLKAINKGLYKVMSKMGISTYQSYCGAQIFEAVGLQREFVDKYFHRHRRATSRASVSSRSPRRRTGLHRLAFGDNPLLAHALDAGGEYQYRIRGEEHAWTPDSIAKLQHAARAGSYATYKEYAALINDQSERMLTLARPVRAQVRARADSARGRRAGRGDRQALRDRRDEPGVDLDRGAHDACGRDEPDRRQVEHRRGRRGRAALSADQEGRDAALAHRQRRRRHPAEGRRFAALEDQAGRLGALRRDRRIPGQRRSAADQDGAGREAGRRRSASGPQGLRLHRAAALRGARASASSRRRRTTTSIRSRTSRS